MDPFTATLLYVSLKFVDQFIVEAGYNPLKKLFFPKQKYASQLIVIIHETINEHKNKFPEKENCNCFPFYESQILFEELNKHIFFNTKHSKLDGITERFKENPSICIPEKIELENFYQLFITKIYNDKKLKKLFIEENYKSKIFEIGNGLSIIESKIDTITTQIGELKKDLTFQPNNDWFRNQCQSSIDDLGHRYTPELNFELEISSIFDGLGKTDNYKKAFTKQIDDFISKGKKVIKQEDKIQVNIDSLNKHLESIFELYRSIDFFGVQEIEILNFIETLKVIEEVIDVIQTFYINAEREIQKEKKEYQYYHKFGSEIRNVREFKNEISNFQIFINGTISQLANNPYLVLDGDAGIGKSHMLGDIISKRNSNNYQSVFLLGQHFVTEEDPWTQIFKKLKLNINSQTFLKKLNSVAEESGKRIIIFIDALNEGKGNYFWENNINSFINEIKQYEWLGLVLTIRSSYKNLIFPEKNIAKLNVVEHTLYGFINNEYEASKLFFNNYNIELPNIPLLHPEFQNPLFLKLFCEGIKKSGLTKIPDGLQGISSIINFFINNVNEALSKPKRFHYSNGINLVTKSINSIIEYKIENDLRYVPYAQSIEIVENTVSKFISKKGIFLDELISEGIFSKNMFWNSDDSNEEGIYLAYERFEDHLTCQYLLEKYNNIEVEFKKDGNLFRYVKDEREIYRNKGLIDAFSIQIPEETNKEFYEYIPKLKSKYPIIESFVDSLIWRKLDTINENSIDYVNKHVFSYEGTYNSFYETILSITSIPNHYYNANSLHAHLMKSSLAERDATWSIILKYKYNNNSAVKRLIDWAWNENDKSHITDESIKLTSIALTWFHTSTNRQLRDCSTKALVSLLQNNLKVLIELLKLFENVNDPYVYERLFAVAYGCALSANQRDLLPILSEYIFETIFNKKDEIYPHVLLRDYARGVIEFTKFLNLNLSFDINLARPPYKSNFPKNILSNKEIDKKYRFNYKDKDYKKHYWSQNTILDSMTTEYGRGIGGYGDFGRYTFQSALRSWDVNPNDLSNIALEWIFEKYGYNVNEHGKFDNNIENIGRKAPTLERIGKKYQWLALYEMIARVSDNFKKFDQWSFKNEKEEPYQGPWDPSVIDIDPSILIKNTGSYDENEPDNYWWSDQKLFNWECTNNEWVQDSNNLPNIENLIQVKDNKSEEWLVLEGYPEWAEPKKIGEEKWDYPHKRLWCHLRSYLVKTKDYDNIREWASKQDFMGSWMPDSSDRNEVFNREFYWSPVHNYLLNKYDDNPKWQDVFDKKTGSFVSKVIIPAEGYSWHEELDKSKAESLSFLKPCSSIFKGMNLKDSNSEGEFLNSKNEMVCFAPNVHYNTKSFLLVKKEPFNKYLKENDLKILWTVLGEKQVIGGFSSSKEYFGRLLVSGAYFFKDNKLEGNLNISKS